MAHIMMPDLYFKPEHRDEGIRLLRAEIEHSLAVEPGVLHFDLVQDKQDLNIVHVYAVYRDEAALESHRNEKHYIDLMAQLRQWYAQPSNPRMGHSLRPGDEHWEKFAREKAARMPGASAKR